MIRDTDLIEETVQLGNAIINLLRKVTCVHHFAWYRDFRRSGDNVIGNDAIYKQWGEQRRLRINVCKMYLKMRAAWFAVSVLLGCVQCNRLCPVGVYFLSHAVIEQ